MLLFEDVARNYKLLFGIEAGSNPDFVETRNYEKKNFPLFLFKSEKEGSMKEA